MTTVLIVVGILVLFILAAVFALLSFLSGRPPSEPRGESYPPPSFQSPAPGTGSADLSPDNLHVPYVFDETRIKSDLAVLRGQPTLLAQYIAAAELRFTQSTQMAVLRRWTE